MIGAVPDGDQTIEKFVFAIIRGDMEVNEIKLTNAVRAKSLRPATEEEIRAIGAIPGYGSPVGVKDALIVVDDAVPSSSNLVAGANEEGYHYLNTNWGRDYHADVIADIATAREGDACAKCGNPLRAVRGVEVGNIFKLGTRYSDALGCTFLDRDGKSKPIIMGSYGIGVGRLLACVAEAHHDDHGLILPISIAPYHIHLVMLPGAETQAEALYEQLQAAQIDVLYDDREERAGVKFNDADLIGIPIRLTVSPRALEQGGVEFKRRDQTEKHVVPLDSVIDHVQSELAALQVEVDKTVVQVKYEE
jgi:prolyl-tRNA synthetase